MRHHGALQVKNRPSEYTLAQGDRSFLPDRAIVLDWIEYNWMSRLLSLRILHRLYTAMYMDHTCDPIRAATRTFNALRIEDALYIFLCILHGSTSCSYCSIHVTERDKREVTVAG